MLLPGICTLVVGDLVYVLNIEASPHAVHDPPHDEFPHSERSFGKLLIRSYWMGPPRGLLYSTS